MFDPNHTIPKNKCHKCFEHDGRFVMSCFCIICQYCLGDSPTFTKNGQTYCKFCGKACSTLLTDVTKPEVINKMSHLFANFDKGIAKIVEAYKLQEIISHRYC